MKQFKTYSLAEFTDKYIGKPGTPRRKAFDNELRLDLLIDALHAKINFSVELLNRKVKLT
jgi:hypothetical protein